MDLHLKDKTVIVTGGGSGIGAGITEVLSEEGAKPIILSREQPDAGWLDAHNAAFYQLELADDAACQEVISEVRAQYGAVYGLVNNAGTNDRVGLDQDAKAFRKSLDQNLVHGFWLVHLLRDDLIASQGAIVNISSKTALTGQGGTSAYAAAKAGQLGLTREWALEFLPFHVRVNAIVVAEAMTPLYERWLNSFDQPEEKLQDIVKHIPLGQRMTTPREIANLCAFLLSDCSSHTTGQWIHPDGGYRHLDRAVGVLD